MPRLNSIDGELKSINTKIDSLKNELLAEIMVVDTKIDAVNVKVDEKIDGVNVKVDQLD